MKCLVWQYLRYHTIPKAFFISVKTQYDSSEPITPEGPNDMAICSTMAKVKAFDVFVLIFVCIYSRNIWRIYLEQSRIFPRNHSYVSPYRKYSAEQQ